MGSRRYDFTQEIADIICDRLMEGESLRAICSEEKMPSKVTVCKWLGIHPLFANQYARAREIQADSMFDEMLDIADDSRNDWMQKRGQIVPDNEAIQRSRLRIDARRWMAGKLRPKKYGDMVGREPIPEGGKESVIRVEGALPGEFDNDE